MSTHTIARGGVDTRERGAFPMPDEARSSTRGTWRRDYTRRLARRRLREMSGYLQDWTVVSLDDGIRWLLRYHAGQLGGGLHGVSVLDGHVVGNSPPSSRRSAKSRSLPRRKQLTLSRFHPSYNQRVHQRALPLRFRVKKRQGGSRGLSPSPC